MPICKAVQYFSVLLNLIRFCFNGFIYFILYLFSGLSALTFSQTLWFVYVFYLK